MDINDKEVFFSNDFLLTEELIRDFPNVSLGEVSPLRLIFCTMAFGGGLWLSLDSPVLAFSITFAYALFFFLLQYAPKRIHMKRWLKAFKSSSQPPLQKVKQRTFYESHFVINNDDGTLSYSQIFSLQAPLSACTYF